MKKQPKSRKMQLQKTWSSLKQKSLFFLPSKVSNYQMCQLLPCIINIYTDISQANNYTNNHTSTFDNCYDRFVVYCFVFLNIMYNRLKMMLQRNVFQFNLVFHWSPALYFPWQSFQVVLFLLYCVSSSCTLTSKQWTWWETDSSAGSFKQEKWDQTKLWNPENTFCSKEGRVSPANATVVCTGINHGAEVFPLPKL